MKSSVVYVLILLSCAPSAFAQGMSDDDWERQAAQQLKSQQQTKRFHQQPAPNKKYSNVAQPARKNSFGSYGYRPQRSALSGGYGYRPQRSQLLPRGYTQMPVSRYAEQMKGLMGGATRMPAGGPMGMMNGAAPLGMLSGGSNPAGMASGAGQQKANLLKMLMGAQQQPQMQMQTPAPNGMNPRSLLQTLMGGAASGANGSTVP